MKDFLLQLGHNLKNIQCNDNRLSIANDIYDISGVF